MPAFVRQLFVRLVQIKDPRLSQVVGKERERQRKAFSAEVSHEMVVEVEARQGRRASCTYICLSERVETNIMCLIIMLRS